MTAYSQNHIVERYPPIQTPELHRVDGLSQLCFSDVPAMAKAMETPEQRADFGRSRLFGCQWLRIE